MDKDIWVALLGMIGTAGATIFTIIATNNKNNALQDERIGNLNSKIDNNNSIVDKKISDLTAKVEQHNTFGLQLAKLETRVDILEKK